MLNTFQDIFLSTSALLTGHMSAAQMNHTWHLTWHIYSNAIKYTMALYITKSNDQLELIVIYFCSSTISRDMIYEIAS